MIAKNLCSFISYVGISQNEEEKEPIRSSIPNGCVPLRGGKYDISVMELGLSVRTMNCLRCGGISTVGEVIIKSEQELFSLRNWGQKSKQELNECLNALALDGDTITDSKSKTELEIELPLFAQFVELSSRLCSIFEKHLPLHKLRLPQQLCKNLYRTTGEKLETLADLKRFIEQCSAQDRLTHRDKQESSGIYRIYTLRQAVDWLIIVLGDKDKLGILEQLTKNELTLAGGRP